MKKPTEPHKPWPPTRSYLPPEGLQVREQVGPIEDEDDVYDEPGYPEVTIQSIEDWAKDNGVDPRSVTVHWHPGSHVYEMNYEARKPITKEMRDEANADYQAALKVFNEKAMPEYEARLAKYETDLRAYYKWQHDSVGQK